MIVIFGQEDDPPISLLLEALQELGTPYAFVDLRALDRDGLQLHVGTTGLSGHLTAAGQVLPLASVRSVYARPLSPGNQWTDSDAAQRASQAFDTFVAWLDISPALVVNRPRAMNSNNSKPMQAQWIGQAGFAVPETLVTSSADEARAFWRAHGRVIFKSISGIRSIVRELDETSARRLELLRDLPVQFQALVPGVDLRVHVVGKTCFAAEIQSDATDYRYARGGQSTRLQKHLLPVKVAKRCVDLAQALELPLAGIDLRLRPDGEYVCFEVNPMPAYSYYESNTGLPISVALANLLVGAVQEFPHHASH
jgi:glutathione synthase/RimK-type ligase-like ATP-grasp enzyme